ncbi:MAG: aminoacyl-tRNA hydrolase [Pirellulaceae bacterium]|jgi:PTH1 family peptidyl-tRNA hydrolase|nr:aminoacyl-tRNA hydrolase [Pirellulaceae bacterium]MDP7015136.1 aminoacyl-tRNA hydrolase [Pirellulaceae bacterium]
MKMIVGLGNPGRKYTETRHNVGFDVIAELARRHDGGTPKAKFQGEIVEAQISGEKVLLLGPLTYMNCSGNCVQPARDFYKLELEDLIVVCDDFNLELARLRFRVQGSAGGQKGLRDILRRLSSEAVPRLRIGIGPTPEGRDVAGFVLSKFTPDDRALMDQAIGKAADGLADWVAHGIEYCMNHYNAS